MDVLRVVSALERRACDIGWPMAFAVDSSASREVRVIFNTSRLRSKAEHIRVALTTTAQYCACPALSQAKRRQSHLKYVVSAG